MKQIRLGGMLFLCLLSCCVSAQRDALPPGILELLERYTENQETIADYTDLSEQLEYYYDHKLDLNRATANDLRLLFFLHDGAINAVIRHKAIFGAFLSVYELQTIEEIDPFQLELLRYFVRTDETWMEDQTTFWEALKKGSSEAITLYDMEFQQRKGYDKSRREEGLSHYAGSPYRYMARYRYSYTNKLSIGYSGEKDMGEPWQKYTRFDFHSAHLFYRPVSKYINTIAVGDFQAQFGQGLTFSSGMAPGKSSYVTNVQRGYQPLRAYRSLNENHFLRGAAVNLLFNKFELTLLGSAKYISTIFNDSAAGEAPSFGSVSISGLHRTATEYSHRHNVFQQIYGGHLRYSGDRLQGGITYVQTVFSKAWIPAGAPYQLYNFNGNNLSNLGADYAFMIRNMNVFGESSVSSNLAFASITGVSVAPDPRLDLSLVYRRFSKDYHASFINPFAENGDGRNEEGLYTGVSLRLNKKLALNTYLDLYRSAWLRFLTDAPSHGTDLMSELQFNPDKSTQAYFRFCTKSREKNLAGNLTPADYTVPQTRTAYRLHIQHKAGQITSKSRVEMLEFYSPEYGYKNGMLIYQDLGWTSPSKRLSLSGRIVLFNVEDYNARLYAVESDVLHQYSIPMYQHSGTRYYALLHIVPYRRTDLWIKYSKTVYSSVNKVGSGLEEIKGNTISDLRLQMRWRF